MTSSGTLIHNGQYILNLLTSIQMPAEKAVVKCAAHKSGNDLVTAGNRFADEMARYCALQSCIFDQGYMDALDCECVAEHLLSITDMWAEIRNIQEITPADEKVSTSNSNWT